MTRKTPEELKNAKEARVGILTSHLRGPRSVSWSWLRNFLTSHSMAQQVRWTDEGRYMTVWVGYGGTMFYCLIRKGTPAHTEFSNNYQDQSVVPLNAAGMPVLAVQDVPPGADSLRLSVQYTAPPATTSVFDRSLRDLQGSDGYFYLVGGELKCRTAAAEGSSVSLNIIDRDDVFGVFAAYGLVRDRLTSLTNVSGTFGVGNPVTGAGGASGAILAVNAGYLDIQHDFTGIWADGQTITDGTSGATATLGAYTEGDILAPFKPFIEDEWLEDKEEIDIDPGGSRPIPGGLYLRFTFYNADTSNNLRTKVTLEGGRLS